MSYSELREHSYIRLFHGLSELMARLEFSPDTEAGFIVMRHGGFFCSEQISRLPLTPAHLSQMQRMSDGTPGLKI
jgi:hypothetical protein